MRFLLILSAIAVLFINGNCHKNKMSAAILPDATQAGKNTVGFTFNGEVWVPYHKCGLSTDPCAEISARYDQPLAAKNSIDFQFARVRNGKESSLSISGPFSTITSTGEKIDSVIINYTGENWSGNNDSYSIIVKPGSSFTITKFDPVNKVISGTFNLTLSEDNRSGRLVILQDGRFDFQFNACLCN
jgi:hypothetical protein